MPLHFVAGNVLNAKSALKVSLGKEHVGHPNHARLERLVSWRSGSSGLALPRHKRSRHLRCYTFGLTGDLKPLSIMCLKYNEILCTTSIKHSILSSCVNHCFIVCSWRRTLCRERAQLCETKSRVSRNLIVCCSVRRGSRTPNSIRSCAFC